MASFLDNRASLVVLCASFSGAFVFFINHTIAIRIRLRFGQRTAIVGDRSCFCGTFIILIIQAIFICIGYGTAFISRHAGCVGAFVHIIGNTIPIFIRAAIGKGRTGQGGASILGIRNTIVVLILEVWAALVVWLC